MRRLLWLLGALALLAFAGPLITGTDAAWKPDWEALSEPPSWQHWLGTDAIGRDVLARSLTGLRTSLLIGVCATFAALLIGLLYGAWAGLSGGRSERLMMRALDVLSALPFLLLVILLLALFERSLWLLLAAIAGQAWIDLARVMRAEASRMRESGFVLAARAAGAGRWDVLHRHALPNLLPLALVYAGLIAANVVLIESFLGFLGLGLNEPWAGLGALLGEGAQELDTAPWVLIGPAVLLCVLLLSFQRLGEALRDALDPRLATAEAAADSGIEAAAVYADAQVAAMTGQTESAAMPSSVAVSGLEIHLPDGRRVGPFDFALGRGECLGLIGGSGSGKSLSALALTGLLPNKLRACGTLRLGATAIDLAAPLPEGIRGARIGLVFQDPLASLHPLRSVGSQLRESLRQLRGLRGTALDAAARAALIEVSLGEAPLQSDTDASQPDAKPHGEPADDAAMLSVERFLQARPGQLSGGQRQRVMIALALCGQPQLLICDEATSALDLLSQEDILAVLERLRRERGLALIFIGHDLDVVARLADRLCVLERGRVVEHGLTATVLAQPKARYTQRLLAACRPAGAAKPIVGPAISAPARAGAEAILSSPVPATHSPRPSTAGSPCRNGMPAHASSGHAREAPVLRLNRFGLHYHGMSLPAVQDVTLELAHGECLAVLGASGSGKSSLVRGLLRLTPAHITGETWLDDAPLHALPAGRLRALRPRAQIVFQDPYSSLDPRQRIDALLAEPLTLHGRVCGHDRLVQALNEVGLEADALTRYPHAFSGGQRQRIAIARALMLQPALLICDEAVSALDAISRHQVLELLRHLQQTHALSLLFITHDPGVAAELAHRTAVMHRGRVVEAGPTPQVLDTPAHAHSRALVKAWRARASAARQDLRD